MKTLFATGGRSHERLDYSTYSKKSSLIKWSKGGAEMALPLFYLMPALSLLSCNQVSACSLLNTNFQFEINDE